jgi:hypothetical protein
LAVTYVFLAGIPYQNLRFGLSLWLPLVIFTAIGAGDLWTDPRWGRPTRVVVPLCLAVMLAWSGWTFFRLVAVQQTRRDTLLEVERRLPQHATLITFELTPTARRETRLTIVELFEQNERSLPALVFRQGVYLLLDTTAAERQWRGRPPWVNLHWLRDHARLKTMAEFPPYTLFEVAPR